MSQTIASPPAKNGANTMTINTVEIEHEKFCLPRPGAKEPRIESFRSERIAADGVTVASRPRVTRCQECGAQIVEEVED